MQTKEVKLIALTTHELGAKPSVTSLDSEQLHTLPAAGLSPASGVVWTLGLASTRPGHGGLVASLLWG